MLMRFDNSDLDSYMRLYENLLPITKMKSLNTKDFLSFKSKTTGNPVKLGDSKEHVRFIPYDVPYFKFFQTNKMFWMIPLEIPDGTIVGFIFKGFFGKEYRTKIFSDVSVLFGLSTFSDFVKNNLVIIVEGSKDCLYIQNNIYKHCLAVNTSKLTSATFEIIRYLTNKVLLIYDNDKTGNFQLDVNKQQFKNEGFAVFDVKYSLKDPGEYFFASEVQKSSFKYEIDKIVRICNRNSY